MELGGNGIGLLGAQCLEIALKENETLKTIVLNNNPFGDEGADCVATALLENDNLQALDMSHCKIGIDGASSLVYSLSRNHTVQNVRLDGNDIGADGRKLFDDALEDIGITRKIRFGRDQVLCNWKRKSAPQKDPCLPQTSLELSMQGKMKSQNDKIAALEAELASHKPEVIDLIGTGGSGDGVGDNYNSKPAAKRSHKEGYKEKSGMAILHDFMLDVTKIKEEAMKRAASAEEKADVAVREREAAKECPYCFEEKEHWYALQPCGHIICSDCKKMYEALPCQTCRKPVERFLAIFK